VRSARVPSAYKVYHFQAIIRVDGRLPPKAAWNDFKIPLDCHPVPRQLQPGEQIRKSKTLGDILHLAVQMDVDQP
jgi:hypothetical protein